VDRRADTSDPKVFDPHATEGAAKRLIKFYRRIGKGEDAKRLSAVIARAFEHFASLGDAMVASAALQTSVNAYREAGMREESQRARVAMEEKIAKSRDEMKPIAIERTIPRETVEQFLESVVVGNIGTTFARIASEFLQGRKGLEDQIKRMEETSPLAAHIPRSIVGDRHVAAKVGSLADDPFGHLINQAAQMVGLSDFWLFHALTRAVEVHQITPYHFATWAGRTKLFGDLTLIMEGVTAWYDQDFVKAIHVLVPQIEVGLRSIVAHMGKPVTKPHPTIPGVSVAIGMGDMLYAKDVKGALGDDLTIHFLALYADPRGFNLRNDLAHGLLGAGRMTMAVASRALHTLLVLGIWDALVKARKTPKEDPPAAQ
jgi:lysyl-tRNA synthetase class 1